MNRHYLVLIPLSQNAAGQWTEWPEVGCWLDEFDAVALGCACGWRLRLLTEAETGPFACFYGEVDEDRFCALTAELDMSEHALVMVSALSDLNEPTDARAASSGSLLLA